MTKPLYAGLLGERWRILPAAIRDAHSPAPRLDLAGRVWVAGETNPPARLIRWMLGFPEPANDITIAVTMQATRSGERWTRCAGGRSFSSELSPARSGGLVQERFGPLLFAMDLPSDGKGLEMIFVAWRLGPLPLPAWLAPRFEAREFVDDRGRFNFDVSLALPLIGRLVAYRGWLELAVTNDAKAS